MKRSEEHYTKQVECDYKKHHYSVRDNGAIMRHQEGMFPFEGAEWTFGTLNSYGKLAYKGVSVERIVATAFLGEVHNDFYVVDHIDGDVQNNSADNLRWLSPIESILDNPETVSTIIDKFGDIETFMIDPSALSRAGDKYSRFHLIKKGDVLDAIKHLVSLSANGPLKSGNIYANWLNSQPSLEDDDSIEKKSGGISLNEIESVWPEVLELYRDTPRFKIVLESMRKEVRGSVLLLFFKNEMQADWFQSKKLQEFQTIIRKLLNSSNIRVEAYIDNK